MPATLVCGLFCAVLSGLGGAAVPRLIAVVPEPEPEPDAEDVLELDPDPPASPPAPAIPVEEKELYADIARIPGLVAGSVVVTAVVGALIGLAVGWAWPLVYLVPAVPVGVALSVIDWRTMRLPTWYLAPAYPVLIVLVVLCAVLTRDYDDLRRAGLGWLVMGGFYFLTNLVSPRLVGFGDVRLAGLLGIGLGYLGWPALLVGMYVAFVVFALPALVLAVVRRDASVLRMRMPFGPAMLAGAVLGVVVGRPLVSWYLGSNGVA